MGKQRTKLKKMDFASNSRICIDGSFARVKDRKFEFQGRWIFSSENFGSDFMLFWVRWKEEFFRFPV